MSYPILQGSYLEQNGGRNDSKAGNMYSGGDADEFEGGDLINAGSGTSYLDFVREYRRKHPKLTQKEAMIKASPSYRKSLPKSRQATPKRKSKKTKGGLLAAWNGERVPHIQASVPPSTSDIKQHIKESLQLKAKPFDLEYGDVERSTDPDLDREEAEQTQGKGYNMGGIENSLLAGTVAGLGTAEGARKARAKKAEKRLRTIKEKKTEKLVKDANKVVTEVKKIDTKIVNLEKKQDPKLTKDYKLKYKQIKIQLRHIADSMVLVAKEAEETDKLVKSLKLENTLLLDKITRKKRSKDFSEMKGNGIYAGAKDKKGALAALLSGLNIKVE